MKISLVLPIQTITSEIVITSFYPDTAWALVEIPLDTEAPLVWELTPTSLKQSHPLKNFNWDILTLLTFDVVNPFPSKGFPFDE